MAPKNLFNPANLVTIGRIALLIVTVLLVQYPNFWIRTFCIAVIPVIFYLDSLDGYLARHHRCATRLGSVLDIVGDRIVESILWILLGFLKVVPLWIPILVLVRGFLTDGLRSIAIAGGQTPFSMMKSRMGWWCVASPFSRTSYAILKAVVFTLGLMLWSYSLPAESTLQTIFTILVVVVLLQSLVRAFYSIRESLSLLPQN
ncbi:CDP-alcohol phosphatidyltransferase family protein [candidate division KSB1 bacterium]|nr:CDP-alcohol phosphatidyltransferase family protein [candidate division KSB1 bacterium]